MKIFSEPLPDGYIRLGKKYTMNTDFRTWLKIESVLSDNDIAPDIAAMTELKLAFRIVPPIDKKLFDFLDWFCRCGEDKKELSFRSSGNYSSDHDEGYIYAAFLQQYNIDLAYSEMHWWKYQALFRGLRDTKFNDIMSWRSAVITVDMPREQREFLENMQQLYAVPETLTDAERRERAQNYYRRGVNL